MFILQGKCIGDIMSQWYLFLISFGCVLIVLSYQATSPILVVISGCVVAGFGAYKLWRGKGK